MPGLASLSGLTGISAVAAGVGGGPPPPAAAGLDFSAAGNGQYLYLLEEWLA